MALEKWQPKFLDWWKNVGPSDFNQNEIYLRTAVGVDAEVRRLADLPRAERRATLQSNL